MLKYGDFGGILFSFLVLKMVLDYDEGGLEEAGFGVVGTYCYQTHKPIT